MRAILVREPGDEAVLILGDAPSPALGPADVRIRVARHGRQPRRPAAAPGHVPAAPGRLADPRPRVRRRGGRDRARRRGASAPASA